MATATNITVNPNPILRIAILTTGREKLALFLDSILRAIKNSVFKERGLHANVSITVKTE
jgi:hypothetical protein